MRTFRNKHPRRTYSGPSKKKHSDYQEELRKDFNSRCAYTDCSDAWWGDGFHVDHFAPLKPDISNVAKKSSFSKLELDYSNLVYACPQVNRAKGNDWASDDPQKPIVSDRGYYDPCSNYNNYFERTGAGGIVPRNDPIAKYMWKQLKLYLIRYELYWRLEQLSIRIKKLCDLRRKFRLSSTLNQEVLLAIESLTAEYDKYFEYLQINYRNIIR